ncbi:MAG: hypothetical protein ACU83U_14870 [Gammaproteobacteria bacterium]
MDYSEWQDLAGRIQPELWPMLFESGYGIRDAEIALNCMLSGISAKQLKSDWPQLERAFPNLRDAAPNLVLAGFRLSECGTTDTEDKVAFLNAMGIKGKINAVNWDLIDNPDRSDQKAVAAIQPFLPQKGETLNTEPRLVDDATHCAFEMDDHWYRYLVNVPEMRDNIPVETVQLIEVAGQKECGLFVGGNRWTINGGVFDSFIGPDEDPRASCPDPPDEYEIVYRSDGHIEHLPTDMGSGNYAPFLLPIKDRMTGQRDYMNTGRPDEMCQPGTHSPEIYRWQKRKGGWVLASVTDRNLENILRSQCVVDNSVVCAGFAALGKTASSVSEKTTEKKASSKQDAYLGAMTVNGFIDAFRAPQRQAFLAAVMALDREALKRFRNEGMPSSWISDAITAVDQSKLPLQDKRQRIAWLFYDHKLLSQAMTNEWLAPLLKWLPREDWGPVLSSIDAWLVGQLVNDGIVKDRQKLECDIAHASNEICDETWGAEEVSPEEAQ